MSEWLKALGPGVANHLWQSTAFAAAAWAVTLLLRRNQARVRYALWTAASLKFLVPFSLLVALGSMLPRPQKPVVAPQFYSAVDEVGTPFAEAPISIPDPAHAPATPRHPWAARMPGVLAAVWIGGVGAVLLVWCGGWLRVKRTLRRARQVDDGRESEILRRIEHTMRLRRPVRLVLSRDLMEPGIFGIWSPVLIWPERLSERLDDEHIHAILAHELMHARRRDNLSAALHMAVEAAFWFHPLVWWMERRMVEERERACDEAVVALGSRPGIYAESLLRACRFCVESPLVCVAGITGADLAARVKAIMTLRLERLGLWRKLVLAAFALVTVSAPILLGQAGAAQKLMLAAVNAAPMPWRTAARAMMPLEETTATELIAEIQPPSRLALPQEEGEGKPFKFDVVSIRPSKPGNGSRSDWTMRLSDDGLQISNMPLRGMLSSAYSRQLQYVNGRILGLPDWARTEAFDVQAKVADSDIAEWSRVSHSGRGLDQERVDLSLLLMLTDQFKLKMHSEDRDEQLYALVAAKGGPKLKPSAKDGPRIMQMLGPGHFSVTDAPIDDIVQMCAQMVGRKVVDKTGLPGKYDYTLDWTAYDAAPTAGSEPEAPPVFAVVQDQLGLKLETEKGPVEYIVVDHAEKPEPMDGAGAPTQALPQAAQAISPASLPSFEVATIKPANPKNPVIGLFTYPGGRIICDRCTVQYLMTEAFGVQTWQLSGGPEWTSDAQFDIEAKPPLSSAASKLDNPAIKTPPTSEQRQMLQSLLIDRFRLKVHREPKEGSVYILSRGDKPLKLQPPKDKDGFSWAGSVEGGMVGTTGMAGTNISMAQLAARLSGFLKLPVLDQTGLAGSYDFAYRTGYDDPNVDVTTAILASMQGIGLRLKLGKGPVEMLVVDHIELPSEN